jgi:hypothetical protein
MKPQSRQSPNMASEAELGESTDCGLVRLIPVGPMTNTDETTERAVCTTDIENSHAF